MTASPPLAPQVPGLRSLDWHPLPGRASAGALACVVRFDVTAFGPDAFAASGLACPPSVRRSVAKRQAEFCFGRLAARAALVAAGRAAADVPIGPSREPVWPEGVIGSISHAGDIAAAAVLAREGRRGIGIDVERIVDDESRPAILSTTMDAGERALLERWCGDALSLDVLATLVFSAKECLFKAAFPDVGRFFGFEAARLADVSPGEGGLTLEIREALAPSLQPGMRCRVDWAFLDDAHLLACCVR